ncbi:60S ribosomal protein L22 [Ordospora colligata]|uniref:Large ribosomal subunit protein eL22 n=1 Tax=Ordospora colligata OC4 TaxID=1354746 RepID=A0A0B2UFR2_9MICR|nr:ribosomal protein L22 [Ordospora colligata OC4]KHN69921.1 ribosomal protein L22 [Ordospora colligata OC4]TBU16091.1 ribosomal protein L22 [Ordospora colligata]TBU16304.1 ribosomal protein L22 [Ordospora colligata]
MKQENASCSVSGRSTRKFFVDCTKPAEDSLISPTEMQAFLQQKIKCRIGKKENLLKVSVTGNVVEVSVTGGFIGKQGLKWQAKRFLHMKRLLSFVKVFAKGDDGFEFRYINEESNEQE